MKKKHQIIMLPSEKPSELCKCNCPVHNGRLTYNVEHKGSKDSVYEPQHLYILSDEEIKKGDWIYADGGTWNGTITRCTGEPITDCWKKIIATTDPELLPYGYSAIKAQDEGKYYPAFIHKHIIEAYVKKPFDEVEVEYGVTPNESVGDIVEGKEVTRVHFSNLDDTWWFVDQNELMNKCSVTLTPKLNQDGTLAVSLVEEKMYSREEVEELCRNSHLLGMKETLPGYPKPETIDEWIIKNL